MHYNITCTYYYSGFSLAAWALVLSITQNKFLPGTHLLHLAQERQSLWTNALSKGIRTESVSNPRPSDYELRARTTTPQCSPPPPPPQALKELNALGTFSYFNQNVTNKKMLNYEPSPPPPKKRS